jgi:hypothetical protein
MTSLPSLSPEQRAELEAWENRALTAEEFDARVRAPWTEHERDDFAALVSWFQRRYPTPAERLAATRVLAAQWARRSGR